MIYRFILLLSAFIFVSCSDNNSSYTDNNPSLEPYFSQQWYLDINEPFYANNSINSSAHIDPDKYLETLGGRGVKIAIIDDGLDVKHEDLNNSLIASYDVSTKSDDVTHENKYFYHGTAVTGIIGARANSTGIYGIANKSEIIFLKFKESMSDSQTIELFNKAEEFNADIINCSWGTYDVSDSVKETIQNLSINGRDGKGIIIVFAAGNDNRDLGNDESAIPEVISVGSSNKYNIRSAYSNHGEYLDILAPGGVDLGITTLDNTGSDGIASVDEDYLLFNDSNYFHGTSASAPIVTGVVALLLEKNPNLTREEVEDILKNSSDKIGSILYENGRNNYYGYGKINLSQAISDSI